MGGMYEGNIHGIKVNVEMIHDRVKSQFTAKVTCPQCPKSYFSYNQKTWTRAKNSAVDNLRTHYGSRHKTK